MCHSLQAVSACLLPAALPLTSPHGLAHPLLPAGFVFLAFGFNWVDAGGLLGGRLDEDIVRVPAAKVRGAPRCCPLLRPPVLGGCIPALEMVLLLPAHLA